MVGEFCGGEGGVEWGRTRVSVCLSKGGGRERGTVGYASVRQARCARWRSIPPSGVTRSDCSSQPANLTVELDFANTVLAMTLTRVVLTDH